MKINHAILHVFDFTACENTFSHEEMDPTDKTSKNYVMRHVRKSLGSLDNKHGEFSDDSRFAEEVRAYFAGQIGFVDLSIEIGEFLARELGYMEKPKSTDLLMVDFEDADDASRSDDSDESDGSDNLGVRSAPFDKPAARYLGIFLLESKQAYVHEHRYGDMSERFEIVRHHAVLPNPSQKVASYALIDLRTLAVTFSDKKRVIAGDETWLIPDILLQCSTQASTKETFAAVTEIVEAVAEEYGRNATVALSRAKAYAVENAVEDERDDLDLREMAEVAFENDPVLRDRFEEAAQAVELPERVPFEREVVRRVARSHKIRTDTGIELTFPAEYSRNPEYITFTSEVDGTISIQLKNIGSIENR